MQEVCQSCQLPYRDGPATADNSEDGRTGEVQGFDERIEVQSTEEKIKAHSKQIEMIWAAGVKTADTIRAMQVEIDTAGERAPRPSYLKEEIQGQVQKEVEKAIKTRIEDAVREAIGSKEAENTQEIIAQEIEAAEARIESRIKETSNRIGIDFEN